MNKLSTEIMFELLALRYSNRVITRSVLTEIICKKPQHGWNKYQDVLKCLDTLVKFNWIVASGPNKSEIKVNEEKVSVLFSYVLGC